MTWDGDAIRMFDVIIPPRMRTKAEPTFVLGPRALGARWERVDRAWGSPNSALGSPNSPFDNPKSGLQGLLTLVSTQRAVREAEPPKPKLWTVTYMTPDG